MEKDLQNLNQIFNKKFFRIPDYQRGYSWGEQQLEDFWEDLELLTENAYHYTGMLTYEKMKNPKDKDDIKLKTEYSYEPFYIVDGQQRFTTISILLKCILNRFEDEELIIDETKKDWEKKFLYKKIEGYEYYLFGYETDNPSNYYFKNTILEKESSDEENKQETIYTHNLIFAKEYFIKYLKDLSKLELLKNRLIYLSTKISDNEDINKEKLRVEINDTWKIIYNLLGKDKKNVLNDDEFLYNHWIMYFPGYNRNEGSVYSNFLLKKKFTIRNILNNELTGKDIKKYVKSLRISINNYFFIKNPTFENILMLKYPKSIDYLEKLNRLGFSSFLPLIISIVNKEVNDKDLLKTLKIIERYVFSIFKICKYMSTYENSKFFRYANKFEKNKISLEEVDKEIENNKNKSFEIDYFLNEMKDKFKTDEGYYSNSWKDNLRYFLFEYELFLKKQAGSNNDEINWKNFTNLKKDHISIEHIYPQSKIKTKKEKYFAHSLGNLLPLSISVNSKLQDKNFLIKKEERYRIGSLSEREIYDNYENWTEKEIKSRGLNLLNFMSERWNIKFEDEDIKLKLLGFLK